MSITIDRLDLGSATVEGSLLAKGRGPGPYEAMIHAFLVRGAQEKPIVIEAGMRNEEVLNRTGLGTARITPEQGIEAQLGRFDLEPSDIGMVIVTHLHLDHGGLLDRFPMSTPAVVSRAEVGFAAGGLQGPLYPPEDLHHMIDRIHTPGAAMVLDVDLSGPVEIAPGVVCEHLGGHTPGLMSVRVETDEGAVRFCSDVIYHVEDQILNPINILGAWEPQVTNLYAPSWREEKAAIWRAMQGVRIMQPTHADGVVLEGGRIVGRVGERIPGPVTPVEDAAQLAPVAG